MFRPQLLKSRAIITNSAQHLHFTTIQMVIDINPGAKSPFTRASNHYQARNILNILNRLPQSRRQLVKHFNIENIQRWPVKNQPQQIILVANTHKRHTKYTPKSPLSRWTMWRLGATSSIWINSLSSREIALALLRVSSNTLLGIFALEAQLLQLPLDSQRLGKCHLGT